MKIGNAIATAVLLGSVLSACSSGTPMATTDGGSLFRCDDDTDCDDGAACTVDSCVVGGTCSFMAVDALCADGESCVVGRGCVAGTTCDSSADCDDAIECTIDSCGVDRMCRHMPLSDLCDDPAAPTCDPTMGCVRGTGCTSAADCDDSIACTVDACGADMACRHTPVNGECAAGETCSVTMGCYTPRPCTTEAECDDGNFCNGVEQCVPEFGCAEAVAPRVCNDSEDCTVDSCDPTLDQCVFRCDPTLGAACAEMCPPPAAGCSGRFQNTGTTTVGCASCTNVDWSEATFTLTDTHIEIRPRNYTTMPPLPGGLVLVDEVEPLCPTFDATVEVGGGCTEHYGISGMFTDDDHFTATVTWRFVDVDGFSCLICGCSDGSATINGTRVP